MGQFAFDGCFGPPITSLSAGLWKVVEAEQLTPPVATWAATLGDAGTGCFIKAAWLATVRRHSARSRDAAGLVH